MLKTVIAVSSASVATAGAIVAIGIVAHQRTDHQTDINRAVCAAVVQLDAAITNSLRRSLTNIPKLQYYKDHPAERDAQLADVRQSINDFKPPPECGGEAGGIK